MRALLFLLLLLSPVASTLEAAGRPLANREIGPSPYPARHVRTAYSSGRFLTVWLEERGDLGAELMGQFADEEGMATAPAFVITHDGGRTHDHEDIIAWILGADLYGEPVLVELAAVSDGFAMIYGSLSRLSIITIDFEGNATFEEELNDPAVAEVYAAWNGDQLAVAMTVTCDCGLPVPSTTVVLLFEISSGCSEEPTEFSKSGGGYGPLVALVPAGEGFLLLTEGYESLGAHPVSFAGIGERIIVDHSTRDPYRRNSPIRSPSLEILEA